MHHRSRPAVKSANGGTWDWLGDAVRKVPWVGPVLSPPPADDGLAQAMRAAQYEGLKGQGRDNVKNVALTALGGGLALGGGAGLYNLLRSRPRRPDAPVVLPLPYPVEPEESPEALAAKKRRPRREAERLAKAGAAKLAQHGAPEPQYPTTRPGMWWYMPAMAAAGLGGAGLGYMGSKALLSSRAKKEREQELERARGEFHDALMTQFDRPLRSPSLPTPGRAKLAASRELGAELDRLFDATQAALARASDFEKAAANLADVMGGVGGAYTLYGGLSSLLAGALTYSAMKKRSRQAILEKAMKKRERERFAGAPTEIFAMPEPVTAKGLKVPFDREAALLGTQTPSATGATSF